MKSRILLLAAGAAGVGLLVWILAGWFPGSLDSDVERANLVRTVAILALVGSGVLMAPRLNLKGALRHAVIWGALGIAVLSVYALRGELATIATRIGGDLIPSRGIETNSGDISIRRSNDGHFHLSAEVNGAPVRFLVDTGASVVTLSTDDAARVGIETTTLDFNQQFRTANGTAWGATVRLNTIVAGPLRVDDVRAAVIQSGTSLLGMSFLDRLDSFSIEGDTMTLKR